MINIVALRAAKIKGMVPKFSTYCYFLAVLSTLAVFDSPAFANESEPILGLHTTRIAQYLRIDDIAEGHLIKNSLRVGDLLEAYRVIPFMPKHQAIQTEKDLQQIAQTLQAGNSIEIKFWRTDNRGSYVKKLVTISGASIGIEAILEEKTSDRYYSHAPDENNEPEDPMSAGPDDEEDNPLLVRVYYATDREREGDNYGGMPNRGEKPIEYGYCDVSMPPEHRMGEIERPSWWKLDFWEDQERHVVLKKTEPTTQSEFFSSLSQRYEDLDKEKNRMLVFVHGFNVTFEEAALRSAQLHYDLQFPGITSFFSWPSDGNGLFSRNGLKFRRAYRSDEEDIQFAIPHLTEYLGLLSKQEDIDEIIVIAHSMGNRAVISALIDLAKNHLSRKISEVILTAPDVDASRFNSDYAPLLSKHYPRTTIYASSKDRALTLSNLINGQFRVGEIRNMKPTVKTLDRLDIIDASEVKTDYTGHSFYGDSTSVITDIHNLVLKSFPANERHPLRAKTSDMGPYWVFPAP